MEKIAYYADQAHEIIGSLVKLPQKCMHVTTKLLKSPHNSKVFCLSSLVPLKKLKNASQTRTVESRFAHLH